MTLQTLPWPQHRLTSMWIIMRRELSESWRDWRIITPILILTFIFPCLMDFTSRWATGWVNQLSGTSLLAERFNPFLLMIVGFFPLSFSLVIALESFVGEKERNSLEALLSAPVTDLELYLGKMFSSLLLPLLASYLGIIIFLISRRVMPPVWVPPMELVILVFLLNTIEALVMVAGAAIISSQTTSIRAANLLASFIIIPMAILVQAMSVIMFRATYQVLWEIGLALLVFTLILTRWGIRIFNREEILAKEVDGLDWRRMGADFKGYLLRPPQPTTDPDPAGPAGFSLLRLYRRDIPQLLRQQALPFGVVLGVTALATGLSTLLADLYPLPPATFSLHNITPETFAQIRKVQFIPEISTAAIFINNVRTVILAAVLSVVSFGSLALLLTFINAGLVGFIIAQIVRMGYNPWLFTAAFILPHGLLEIPAILIGMTFALRIGATLVAPPPGLSLGQAFLLASANFTKVLVFLIIPMLLLAAFIEANITPQVILAVYGR